MIDVILKEVTLVVGLLAQGQLDLPEDEVICLARNVYHEARGESFAGQFAVAQVTLNRVATTGYPETICDVVYQPGQFSWTNDGRSDVPRDMSAYQVSMLVAIAAMSGVAPNPAPGATHFYAQSKVQPDWATDLVRVARIGGHTFMTELTE